MGRSHATAQRPEGGKVSRCFLSFRRWVHPLALPGWSLGLPRRMPNRCTRPGGVPPCVRNVAGLAALREVNRNLMGRSHATTQRRDVRKEENCSADLERSVVRCRGPCRLACGGWDGSDDNYSDPVPGVQKPLIATSSTRAGRRLMTAKMPIKHGNPNCMRPDYLLVNLALWVQALST
jgi:hypothetical protein